VILLVLAGSALTTFPKSQLFWGTTSLAETWRTARDLSFGEINDYLVNPLLAKVLRAVPRHLPRAAVRFVFMYAVLLLLTRRLRYRHTRSRLLLAGSLLAVFVLTLVAHWLQFRFLKIPLPWERTSLFLVPLVTAVVGAVLSVTPVNSLERFTRAAGIGVMFIAGICFLGTVRDTYFREWTGCADLKSAFPVIVDFSRRAGVGAGEIPTDWNYKGALDFYRILYHVKNLGEFRDFEKTPPTGKPIYVLPEGQFADFIRKEGLKVAYHGTISDLVVLYRPDALAETD
jgi:hypothetical protein